MGDATRPDDGHAFGRYLESRGLRLTPEREAVLKAALRLGRDASAKAVCDEARRLSPGIGQATVFRTMRLLEESGLASRSFDERGVRLYTATRPAQSLA